MQFTIYINQAAVIHHKHTDIDLNDLAIIGYIHNIIPKPNIQTLCDESGKVWYWISYKWIKDALPIVFGGCSEDTVYRKVKKLVKLGYIDFNSNLSKSTGKSLLRIGKKSDSLIFSDVNGLNYKELYKNNDIEVAAYIAASEETSDGGIGRNIRTNNTLVSNITESSNSFFPLNSNTDNSKDLESASVREAQKEEEVDFSAVMHDYVPEGIQPSKKPFVAPECEKVYKYPPFHPTAPASIRNDFEIYVDAGKQGLFEYINYNHIAWRQIKSDKNERPWDPKDIDIDFLNETCKGAIPVKKYIGVKATKLDQSVKKEYHYINLFNYDYMAKPNFGPQVIKPIMDTATDYCESYYRLLKELYEKKVARKEQLKRIELNRNLPEGYEGIDNE